VKKRESTGSSRVMNSNTAGRPSMVIALARAIAGPISAQCVMR
jgi:hypothetical protein